MPEELPDTDISNEKLPSFVPLGSMTAVVAINLIILGYALFSASPREHADASPVGEQRPGTITPTAAAESVPDPIIVTDIALPGQEEVDHLFIQHCAACHGLDGRGRGPAAEQLYPKPRDFVDSPFRFASTTGERDEIIAALERTIAEGVPRSAMPGFHGVLSESQIAGLARHVLSLREEQGQLTAAEVHIEIGRHPPFTSAMVERGKELYTSLGCITCHGENGHGDGPGSYGLFDSTNRPVRPADLASGLYKSGQTSEGIAKTILAGVPGTPMTPYEPMLVHEQADGTRDVSDVWALVAYIQSLSPRAQPPGIASGAEIVVVEAVDEAMLEDPAHVAWLGIDDTVVTLRPLWQRPDLTNSIHIRAVRTEDRIAICLDWKDETPDLARDIDVYPDGAAIMFAMGEEVPALPMGVEIEAHEPQAPVNIWHWRADRQYDAATGERHAAVNPLDQVAERSWMMFSRPGESRIPAPPSAGSPMSYDGVANDSRYYTAGAVGNEIALEQLTGLSVLEANAIGFGTLSLQEPESQHTNATAAWSSGTWRIVIVRDLRSGDVNDIQFGALPRIPVAFAVWNGAEGDHAGVKMISGWHWLAPTGAAD